MEQEGQLITTSCKWEYLDTLLDHKKSIREQLNWHGHADWELVQILGSDTEYATAIFKRRVLGDAAVGERPVRDEDSD